MTPLELVSAVRSLGAELFIRDGELRIVRPRNAPPELDSVLALIRQDREAVKAALEPVCIDCRKPVAPEALFCDECFRARKIVPLEELTRRREERRKSTEARLRSTPCGSCGRIDWHVTARGDAHCRACFPARRTS
ncbi:MAG: hypothetical protein IT186_09075 [Acidobacteria bacterium]|nr:hypothetical protein [Acidobacteriota bacterium]